MTETMLFVAGFFCFVLTVLGVVLTVIEFKKQGRPVHNAGRTATHDGASVHQLRRSAA
jgi:hypothetical protein